MLSLSDVASMGKVDSAYRFVSRIWLEGIRAKQENALVHHATQLTPYERSECLVPIRHITLR